MKEKKSLVKLISEDGSPANKKAVKTVRKQANFSLPTQRLADLHGLKNNFAIRRYDWSEPSIADTSKKSKYVISSITIDTEDNTSTDKIISNKPHREDKTEQTTTIAKGILSVKAEAKDARTVKKTKRLPAMEIDESHSHFAAWLSGKRSDSVSADDSGNDSSSAPEHLLNKGKIVTSTEDPTAVPVIMKSEKSKSKKKGSKKSKDKKKKKKELSGLKEKIEKSVKRQEGVVTETLAGLYADQGYNKKAINAYKQLSLIYPQKSSFFALLIEDLKKKLK